jgi:hypothetical protein
MPTDMRTVDDVDGGSGDYASMYEELKLSYDDLLEQKDRLGRDLVTARDELVSPQHQAG